MSDYPYTAIAEHLQRMFPDTGRTLGWLVTSTGYEEVEVLGPSTGPGLRGGLRLPIKVLGRRRNVHPFLVRRSAADAAWLFVKAESLVEDGDCPTIEAAAIHLVEATLRKTGD